MVERAFRVLDLLSVAVEGMTFSDLARALDVSKGSLHGLLKTLESCDAVALEDTRRYVLGPRVYELAQAYVQRGGLLRCALPAMRRLAATIGETVFLGRVEHDGVRIVERIEAPSEQAMLRISAPRGTRVHLLAGATGRLVLASWPEPERQAYLRARPLPHFTPHSITDPDVYLAAVAEAARAGIGEDHEEYLSGVNAVAAPIYDPSDTLVALLWVVGFATRLSAEALRHAGEQLRAESQAISHALWAG